MGGDRLTKAGRCLSRGCNTPAPETEVVVTSASTYASARRRSPTGFSTTVQQEAIAYANFARSEATGSSTEL